MTKSKKTRNQSLGNVVSCNDEMHQIFDLAIQASQSNIPIIITGESGTGKSILAREIHLMSNVRGEFVSENCAAFSETLLESELFGYNKGAFTGANIQKNGLLLAANNGTLFLDEVGDMPMTMQTKLLCALEKKAVRKIGSCVWENTNFRLICATNKSLRCLVQTKLFREDLLYRLQGIELHLLPLRKRKEDIPLLIENFLQTIPIAKQKNIHAIDHEAQNLLINYHWPGNIRQLHHEISRIVALKKAGNCITCGDLSPQITGKNHRQYRTLKQAVVEFENRYIQQTLKMVEGNKSKAAGLLGISRRCLYYKIGVSS
ncbi:sigma 54-interacting transcriptional regulator [Candidatus Uabimicrobium amorphum]|uniref:Acetoacetate metabolism regulatory protein AtoC n=1 Tax=Uabimicrobium amorphum TaxID=2596890 RepID=A0A5S9IV86_UABAM|nr:sigma-54 dependent transcriptional regulator [Candidatus Uabimicrobium amorphum]BBM87195.1 acetoacetate metabolism regulatory protein AtoC [Candidatus Uabimicrobium amorphum]